MIENTMPRAQRAKEDTWQLEDIYASQEQWEQDYEEAGKLAENFSRFAGKLSDRDTCLAAALASSKLDRLVENLYTYAKMRRDEDNNVSAYQALTARAENLIMRASTATAFLSPELTSCSEEYIASLIADPAFANFSVMLENIARRKPHTLSAAEERIVAMTGEIGGSASNIYDMLTDADMKFPTIKDENGEDLEITHANYIPTMMCGDRSVRKAAYEALYGTYKSFGSTIATIYASSVKSDIFYAKAANFGTCLEASLFPDQIPVEVYNALIDTVHKHLPALNRLVKTNAKHAAGLDDPAYYDLYVTPKDGFDISVSFDEAIELICDCLKPLGEEYTSTLRRARKERWIDCYENVGKSSGAYSWGTYDSHPYVLMSYKRNFDAVSTLAHELGHAMHSYYSNKTQCFEKAGYSLFVAEVASTVNEVLLAMELLERYKDDKNAQLFLLYNLLDGFRGTVFRQTMFAEFEKESHAMAEAGQPLTAESLNEVHDRLNKLYYPCCTPDSWIGWEWMRIPHFYRSFYVYKYATGFSAACAIASRIRSEGEAAVADYKKFLSAGGSLPPIEALKLAGVDMSTSEPVDRALNFFEELLARYEELCR